MNTQLSTITAWLSDIDEGYLEAWANRGLLRRGRKLLSDHGADSCSLEDTHYQATLGGHQQRLEGPGFSDLSCSCPAVDACHHLIAFLLALKTHASVKLLSAETSPDNKVVAPWLAEPFEPIEKQLGKAHLTRARRLLQQAVEVELEENSSTLIAQINDGQLHTVRIPMAAGIAGSVCTCGAEHCVHRAVSVLSARAQAGLYKPDDVEDALTIAQQEVVAQIRDWLRELVSLGSAGLSAAHADQGEALSTVARQADFPALASGLNGIVNLLRDELAGRSYISAADFRSRLSPIWSRLSALQTNPLPQPLLQLAGEHKRHYKLVRNLQLTGVGAEAWRSPGNYLGLSLHLFAPETGQWYRQTQVRRADQTNDDWSPEKCWQRGNWSVGLGYRQIPGASIRLNHGWVSGDGQLSGRDGTRLSAEADTYLTPPGENCFASLGRRYAQLIADDPLATSKAMPAIVEIEETQKPQFNVATQLWSQSLKDVHGHELSLEITLNNDYAARARATLDNLWRQRLLRVFGFVILSGRRIVLRPVSVQSAKGDGQWLHLTLK